MFYYRHTVRFDFAHFHIVTLSHYHCPPFLNLHIGTFAHYHCRPFSIFLTDFFRGPLNTFNRTAMICKFAHFHIIGVRLIIFNLPETCINSKLRAVIVNDPFHFFLEKKWSKKIGLRNKS